MMVEWLGRDCLVCLSVSNPQAPNAEQIFSPQSSINDKQFSVIRSQLSVIIFARKIVDKFHGNQLPGANWHIFYCSRV